MDAETKAIFAWTVLAIGLVWASIGTYQWATYDPVVKTSIVATKELLVQRKCKVGERRESYIDFLGTPDFPHPEIRIVPEYGQEIVRIQRKSIQSMHKSGAKASTIKDLVTEVVVKCHKVEKVNVKQ